MKAFSAPKHWEDWVGVVVGIWLWASPWVLQYSGDMLAIQNAFITGFLLIAAELVILSAFRAWEEWANVGIGVWLVISPWVLGVTATLAMANFIVAGVVVLGLALYELWDVRHHLAHPA
ncbi:MAG: SPW repeat protein [Proteobacteria bacterium]|nr:SPW repeat protein [Pseudomonadota bacterium]